MLHYDCRDAEEDEEIDEHSHAHDDHHHGGFADAYTYEINGYVMYLVWYQSALANHSESFPQTMLYPSYRAEAIPIGSGDLHDTDFSSWERRGAFNNFHIVDGSVSGIDIDQRCIYHLDIYPSQKFFDEFRTSLPISITCSIAAVFLFTIIMFVFYNQIVEKRQKVVVKQALQSTAIISSLFPKQVRDKLMESSANNHGGIHTTLGTKNRLKGFLAGATEEQDSTVAPIADFFPNCTVFFGDLTGFTAWSSTREPDQVFTLLQTVYQGEYSLLFWSNALL